MPPRLSRPGPAGMHSQPHSRCLGAPGELPVQQRPASQADEGRWEVTGVSQQLSFSLAGQRLLSPQANRVQGWEPPPKKKTAGVPAVGQNSSRKTGHVQVKSQALGPGHAPHHGHACATPRCRLVLGGPCVTSQGRGLSHGHGHGHLLPLQCPAGEFTASSLHCLEGLASPPKAASWDQQVLRRAD